MNAEETCFTPVPWDRTAMEWRKLIGSPFCNLPSGHKHVLTTLSRWGKKYGEDIFPSQREQAFRAGVTQKCINRALKRAELHGWIIRYSEFSGRGYKRNTYELSLPAGLADMTVGMKHNFWTPPYHYKLVCHDGELFLEERNDE